MLCRINISGYSRGEVLSVPFAYHLVLYAHVLYEMVSAARFLGFCAALSKVISHEVTTIGGAARFCCLLKACSTVHSIISGFSFN